MKPAGTACLAGAVFHPSFTAYPGQVTTRDRPRVKQRTAGVY